MRLFYPVKEAFLTLQGEGFHAGARAVFVRFAGCNVWSGHSQDRERDTAKGCCAAWCDTDFVGTDGTNGGKLSATDIAKLVVKLWREGLDETDGSSPLVVITGGEPSLVLDEHLVDVLHDADCTLHVETNGSKALPLEVDWITLSPKPPMKVVQQAYDEVKVVYPAVNPCEYERYAQKRYVQPLDVHKLGGVLTDTEQRAAAFVLHNPGWRLSLQTHKLIGLP